MAKCAFCSARLTPVDGRCRYCGMARSGPSAAWGVPEWASPVELQPVTRGRQALWLMSTAAIVAVASVVLYLNGAFGPAPGSIAVAASAAKVADGIEADPLADPAAAIVAVITEQVAGFNAWPGAGTVDVKKTSTENTRLGRPTRSANAVSFEVSPATVQMVPGGIRFTEPSRFALQLPAQPTVRRYGTGSIQLDSRANGVTVRVGALAIPSNGRPADAALLKAGLQGVARRVNELQVAAVKGAWEYTGVARGVPVRGRIQVSTADLIVTEVSVSASTSARSARVAFNKYGASVKVLS